MKCKDLITRKPFTVTEDETVDRCARIMRAQEIGFLPVLDERRRVIGVVTDRDLATRVLADRLSPDTKIGEIMTTGEIAFCGPEDDLAIAESRMKKWRKSRLVVMDEFRHCLGVISISDVARSGGALMGGRVLGAVAQRESILPEENPGVLR